MRVMSYSCPYCNNTGHNLDVEDGLCTCPFGMEMRKRWNPAYRTIPAPPPASDDDFIVRRPMGDPRVQRPMASKRQHFPGIEKHGAVRPL